ncbi:DNA primase [Demequina zhanjiangensis]|uniref:DNA primase n=1 Tax=Demequina zhanjiangensis TaxID=3051659 RepID=A0ABT8G099_9MICO|nr:DNA primase [Demequina sp. SYSU T00b26]MDN4472532.1 DNA primase [Demequina sp. SYSU T00b26]
MAGTINREDIAAVRERAPLEDIVGQHVALKPAGVGSLKGLCPFHDERSPSFHVRPQAGRWHCFGCGEGGDVIEFVMRMDGLTFVDAVEYLAERAGVTLRYEQGAAPRKEGTAGQRKRLLDAHRVAAEFFVAQLATPEAKTGRDFLMERGFGREAAAQFGVGYAPQGWQALTDHLRRNGFTDAELRTSGLVSEGSRGVYDRFRGRLVWPIRDVTGEVIGFGARRLYEDDQGPKYLNTPETPLYKKAQVLYGLDLAKGTIRSERTVVVVEGYTDVMACHLAGVTNAVATCGTAFGEDHVKVVRRLMGDTGGAQLKIGSTGSKVIFTFDGDEAGQNAALKAFSLDQQFLAQTFVAVDADGQDPCEIRQHRGDEAVRALMESRVPLFEFVLKTTLATHDLNTIEGRVAALRAAAPVVAGIRDRVLQPEYARRLAGWLGMDVQPVRDAVSAAARSGAGRQQVSRPHQQTRQGAPQQGRPTAQGGGGQSPQEPYDDGPPPIDPETGAVMQVVAGPARPSRRDPVVRQEALSLGVLLQLAGAITRDSTAARVHRELAPDAFTVPQYRAVFEAMMAAGGPTPSADWVDAVVEQAGPELAPTISELAVTPLPHEGGDDGPYAASVLARLLDFALTRRIAETRGAMQRAGEGSDAAQEAFARLLALESQRRALRGE